MTISRNPFFWATVARDIVGFAVAASTGIFLWLRKRSSRYWPLAPGNVESASSFQYNSVWRTDVAYSYSIGDEFYAGEFQLRSSNERKANEKELRWKGRNIRVRYSPRNSQISVVRIEDQTALHAEEYIGH
jgi:Protein of unknown function (DUF3592)